MNKLYSLFFGVLFTIFLLFFCHKDKDPVQPALEYHVNPIYLSFINRNCQGSERGLDKALTDDFYLQDYFVNIDTLTLRIHYPANCCPAFVDSAAVNDGSITIALGDTLNGCRCMCDYENDFVFLYSHKGELHVIFKWWFIDTNEFTTKVDTFILIN